MKKIMRPLLTLCALINFTGSLSAKSKLPQALSEVYIARVINDSSGIFRIYLSDKEVGATTIMPHSTAELKKSVPLSPTSTVWLYPIQGPFETIFVKMGAAASGICDKDEESPIVMSFWYDNPSLPLNLRNYRRLCMDEVSSLQLTIERDGSITLNTIEV